MNRHVLPRGFRRVAPFLLFATLAFFDVPGVRAQSQSRADSIVTTPRGRYDAGFLHRLLLSSGHRDLWATPVKVEVLDLNRFGGGLTLEGTGGGLQTRSLRFRGADGRSYAFRSIDKDAGRNLDPELQGSIAERVLQDQIGSLLPLAAVVVAPLIEAAGVLQAYPRLAVMPDDARLGEHRAEFAGLIGFIEERPNEGDEPGTGFAGSARVIGSPRLFERLEESSANRVDDAAFLRARLMDALVGDWDRHPDQWRWAGFEEGGVLVFRPIPRDRDWALARMDGLIVQLIPIGYPQYVGFGYDYPSAFRLMWAARVLDRQLLSGTPRATWDAVVADLVSRLTDNVIDDAVRRLPDPYYQQIGEGLAASLRNRRDELPRFADAYYRILAGWVDIYATDERDLAEIVRLDDGRLQVEITSGERRADASEPYFRRVFEEDETREIRLFLRGGADRAAVIGTGRGGPKVRIIGGGGDDTLIDRTSGRGVHFYDDRGQNQYERAPGTSLDESTWVPRLDTRSATQQALARDWGVQWLPAPVLSYDPDLGFFAGGGATRMSYGFRHFPYRSKLSFSAGIGTNAARPRLDFSYDFPAAGRVVRGLLHARYSGAEVDRFYGFGNETPSDRNRAFYKAQRAETTIEMHVAARTDAFEFSVGPGFTAVQPFGTEGTLVDSVAPYGFGNFEQIGVTARLMLDGRDQRRSATRGAYLLLRSRVFPSALDLEEVYGGLTGEAGAYLTAPIPTRPTLALRAGGEKTWGQVPYFDAAYLGGKSTLRGFPNRRFAGDAALYGNAELRLRLFRHGLLFPGYVGVMGLGDAGRVYVEGEDSDEWHTAFGGGLWLSFLRTGHTLTLAVARSAERTGVYLGSGFAF